MPGIRKRYHKDGYNRGWYVDATAKRQFFKGTRDRKETLALAWDYQRQADRERHGLLPPAAPQYPFVDIARDYLEWGERHGGRNGRSWSPIHAPQSAAAPRMVG